MRIGVVTLEDLDQAAERLGYRQISGGSAQKNTQAIFDDINKKGGVLGRKVVPVFHDVKTADLIANSQTEASAICSDFTRDREVAAVVNFLFHIEGANFWQCFTKAKLPYWSITQVPRAIDDASIKPHLPYMHNSAGVKFENFVPKWLDRLQALKYFTGWNVTTGAPGPAPVRVGLLYADQPADARTWQRIVKPALTKRGIDVVAEYAFSGNANSTSENSNAALEMANANVTHVLGDFRLTQWSAAAKNQKYYPRFGLNSTMQAALVEADQAPMWRGAVGIGWMPPTDMTSAGGPDSAPPKHPCLEIVRRATSINFAVDRSKWLLAGGLCDAFSQILDSAKASGGFSPEHLQRGLDLTASSFQTAWLVRAQMSSQRPSAVSGMRDLGFVADCSCFRYLSSTVHPL